MNQLTEKLIRTTLINQRAHLKVVNKDIERTSQALGRLEADREYTLAVISELEADLPEEKEDSYPEGGEDNS